MSFPLQSPSFVNSVLLMPIRLLRFFGLHPARTKFRAHRIGGIFLIVTYLFAWFSYFYDYENLFLVYAAPLWPALGGTFQSISATITFYFLPKMKNSGALSRKGTLSHNFVKENVFYQLLVLFWVSYFLWKPEIESTRIKIPFVRSIGEYTGNEFITFWASVPLGKWFVVLGVFLPFTLIRPFFPVTPFKYDETDEVLQKRFPKSAEEHYAFPWAAVLGMRFAYMILKHTIYFGVNYRWFLAMPPADLTTSVRSLEGTERSAIIANEDLIFHRDSWPMALAYIGGLNWLFFQHTLILRGLVNEWVAEIPLGVIIALTIGYVPKVWSGLSAHDGAPIGLSLLGILVNVAPYYATFLPRKFIHVHYGFTMLVLMAMRKDDAYGVGGIWESISLKSLR